MFSHPRAHHIAQFTFGIFIGTLVAWIMMFVPLTPTVNAAPKATTWHVNKLTDTDDGVCDTNCSLREAISNAVNGDAIDFPSLSGTIVLSPSLANLILTQAITITSPPGAIRISGGNAIRVMTIGANATINGLIIRDGTGSDGYGGGILISSGNVNIINTQITSNTATIYGGGGISNFGSLTLTNSTIRDNIAANGGGIQNNNGLLTLNNVTVTNNIATVSGGGIYGSAGTVTLTTTQIYSNAASSEGGGIYALSSLNLISSNVYSNTSTSSGAGIRMSGTSMALEVDASTIYANSCVSCSGGGIYSNGIVNLSNTSIYSNTSGDGAGIYKTGNTLMTLTGVTLSGNQAIATNAGGGGIRVDSSGAGTMNLVNVTLSNNSADPIDSGRGGGILSENVIANLSHVTITKNKTGNNGGGGIRTTGVATFTIQNTLIAGNTATGYGQDCDFGLAITSNDYNLVQVDCGVSGITTHNITGQDPKLTPLAGFGGPTFTHALFAGSPAINAIPSGINGCGTTFITDQRGRTRPDSAAGCDIGAFEGIVYQLYLPLIIR